MANYKKPNPKTPEERMERFLEAGGKLTEAQWKNMSARTRKMYNQNKEESKSTAGKAEDTGKSSRAALKSGDYK